MGEGLILNKTESTPVSNKKSIPFLSLSRIAQMSVVKIILNLKYKRNNKFYFMKMRLKISNNNK